MFKFINDLLQSIQKAAIAAHFARLGQRELAVQAIAKD